MFHGARDITTLYRLSFSIYICSFHVRACRRRLHTRTHGVSLRPCGCVHFRPGYVRGYVKRKHQGNRYRRDAACPCFMVSLIPFREVDLYESPRQEFYPRHLGAPRGLLTTIVLFGESLPAEDNSEHKLGESNATCEARTVAGEARSFGFR